MEWGVLIKSGKRSAIFKDSIKLRGGNKTEGWLENWRFLENKNWFIVLIFAL